MPAIGNITVNDGEATPVAHTFSPVTTNGSLAKLANRAASSPIGEETLSVEVINPKATGQAYQVVLKGYDPVTATVEGVDQVVKYNSFELRFNLSQLSTTQEAKNLRMIAQNLLANATISAVIDSHEPIY